MSLFLAGSNKIALRGKSIAMTWGLLSGGIIIRARRQVEDQQTESGQRASGDRKARRSNRRVRARGNSSPIFADLITLRCGGRDAKSQRVSGEAEHEKS
jgi:hypothetical protein